MEGLTEGRIVHFVMERGDHRPAIVVKNWGEVYPEPGVVNLQVFTDGANDGIQHSNGLHWATSVRFSEEPKPGTWHWIERA